MSGTVKIKHDSARQQISDALSSTLPGSCFVQVFNAVKETENPVLLSCSGDATTSNIEQAVPGENAASQSWLMEDLVKPYKYCHNDDEAVINGKVESFLESIPKLNSTQVNEIEKATNGQSNNDNWFQYRKGRITASKFYQVHTKVNSILIKDNGKTINVDSLISTLMNYKPLNPDIPALKYGRNMEEEAKRVYNDKMRKKHTGFQFRDCGLFLYATKPYLGATPDQLLYCKCCGEGLLEIKCPYSIRHTKPTHENVAYITLDKETGLNKLKQTHSYYSQVQGQMAITGREWCDFFVYTAHGYLIERIYFNEHYWLSNLKNLEYFFNNYVAVELVTGHLIANMSH